MSVIPSINGRQVEAISKVLGDKERGLSGQEIGRLLGELGIRDPDPTATKWQRLYSALTEKQKTDGNAGSICRFIEAAMEPVRYSNRGKKFEERRDALNQVVAFLGFSLGEDGKLRKGEAAKTLSEAEKRGNCLRAELQRRRVHPDILAVCQERFLRKDYFYAVLEATKSVAEKIRQKSGLTCDGVPLVSAALDLQKDGYPLLAFNSLQSDSEKSEHRGLANLMKGLFGAFRNPTAHQPEDTWPISEQDALDLLTTASLIHRRLDAAVCTLRTTR